MVRTKLRHPWGLLLLAALSAACAAASCAASGNGKPVWGAGGTGGASAASTSSNSGHGGATHASSGTGGITLAGSTSSAQSSSSGGPPDPCSACQMAGGQCSGGDCTISDNPGNVDTGTQGMLTAGGSGDPGFAWLYPYDKTVFPRGLTPPTLQFGGTTPDAFYVHVSFPGMDYKGFYTANSLKGFAFSVPVWKAITGAAHATSPVSVAVTKIAGGIVSGPITETWTVAQGSLRGTIYYETYGSTIIAQSPNGGGPSGGGVGIMKIQPGASAPDIVKSQCGNVCHTASADGSTLVSNAGTQSASYASESYDLKNDGPLYATQVSLAPNAADQIFTYGGLYPDGSFVVSATGYRTYTPTGAPIPGLYYTGSTSPAVGGAQITAAGFDNVVLLTGTPAFSPDGKMLAFNGTGSSVAGGPTLSIMDFEHTSFTFRNKRDVATHKGQTVAWPAFTPDGKWVVYHAGSSPHFETDLGATGEVYVTSATANTPRRLDALDGYDASGSTYLPEKDTGLSFAPTVLPEAVGGYFWVVFTSHRSYGNALPSRAALQDGSDGGTPDALGKLWVAAFDLTAAPGADPSHPAFYLDGQELEADNLRGFWVLDPCHKSGTPCTFGDECCGGFCRSGHCASAAGGCSDLYEFCTKAADCCLGTAACINGRCAQPPPG